MQDDYEKKLKETEEKIHKLKKSTNSRKSVIIALIVTIILIVLAETLPSNTLLNCFETIHQFVEDYCFILLLIIGIPFVIFKYKKEKKLKKFSKEDLNKLKEYKDGERWYIQNGFDICETFDKIDDICLSILVTNDKIEHLFPINFTPEEKTDINTVIENKLPGYEDLENNYKLAQEIITILLKYYDENGKFIK